MNNKTLLWVLGGCAVILLVCCVGTVLVGVVFQNQMQEILASFAGIDISTGSPSVPPAPVGGITPMVPSANPTALAPASSASSAASSSRSSVSAATGNPFSDAISKAKSASKYRMQFAMIVGGTNNNKYTEETLFDMTGEVDGQNTHFSSKGGFLAILAGDANGTVEFMTAGGKTYMKGVKMFGLTDPKVWYVTSDNSMSGGMEDMVKPDTFQDYVNNPADFKKVGTEAVDGQSCDIYAGALKGFDASSMLGVFGGGKDTSDIGVVDTSETRIWLCADGYAHKFSVNFEGHNSKNPAEKGAFKMNGHMWDFNNAAIKVTPPTDAKPMPGSK
jgi:hypothetical protein